MTDNLKTRAVIQDKILGIWNKVGQSVKNVGKGEPSWEVPVSFKVVSTRGVLVRKGFEEGTEAVLQLSEDDIVTVIGLSGRRARIISPVEGWVSVKSQTGLQLLRRCRVQQRKAEQAEMLEKLFEQRRLEQKKKSRQAGSGGNERDCRSIRLDRKKDLELADLETHSDTDSCDREERRPSRDAISLHESSKNSGAAVPRLAAPGNAAGPVILASPPTALCSTKSVSDDEGCDLLDFDVTAQITVAQEDVPLDPSGRPVAVSVTSTNDDWADFQSCNPHPSVQIGLLPGHAQTAKIPCPPQTAGISTYSEAGTFQGSFADGTYRGGCTAAAPAPVNWARSSGA